ncbi:MAG: adenylate/guanylate cyclase domain-containing protein [Chitinophagaceae bacterium]|nr:adenylate/guanylate cyclase domain-containing protein [Chitinophagaceae bacterium]
MHKLSAVLFADIAGYTAMMQEDEKTALQLINKFKKDIEKQTEKFNGRIVQYYGDGCLLTFESSTDAVDCAISMQYVFSESPVIPVRIGIHMGEIMFRNNGAFGNGVNIASRIESMGIPGSILVSKTIRDQIINKSSFLLASLGTFHFKNVKEPMEVFALANEGFVIPDKSELEGKFKLPSKSKIPKWLTFGIPALLLAAIAIVWFLNLKKNATTLSDKQREQPVAVMAFENLTKDKNMGDLGLMIKDWISYGLLESEKAPVIILDEEKNANTKDEKEKLANIPTGVGLVVKGRFFDQSEEQIAAIAEILDVKTNKILFTLKPVVAKKTV